MKLADYKKKKKKNTLPEETAVAATPPSSAAIRCSNTSLVGFMILYKKKEDISISFGGDHSLYLP
jgi:hypothetical protein